jgi:isopentenyl-diphosphate delta-isomerase
MSAAQVLDAVNEQDQRIGWVARGDVFRLKANFRVAHVFIFNHGGELLLQEIAATRSRHPGRWGSSVAAYVSSGEDYAQAAKRRLEDELGIPDANLVEIGKIQMIDEGCHKFVMLFSYRHSGPFAIDSSHIARVEFVPVDQVCESVENDPSRFTPTFVRLLDFYTSARPS